jgi:hypothetical protein
VILRTQDYERRPPVGVPFVVRAAWRMKKPRDCGPGLPAPPLYCNDAQDAVPMELPMRGSTRESGRDNSRGLTLDLDVRLKCSGLAIPIAKVGAAVGAAIGAIVAAAWVIMRFH